MNKPAEDIREIRKIMENSARFISLSGTSGIFVGLTAIVGLTVLLFRFDIDLLNPFEPYYMDSELPLEFIRFAFADALIVLTISLGVAIALTVNRSRKLGRKTWDKSARRLVINLFLPLVIGGFFCLALMFHHKTGMIAPATLVFYGLALLHASKYSLEDIRVMGLIQSTLGIIGLFRPQLGLVLWALGFGILHIVYGMIMYYKYDRGA